MKFLFGKSRRDKKRYEKIRDTVVVENLDHIFERKRKQRFGHTKQMDSGRMPRRDSFSSAQPHCGAYTYIIIISLPCINILIIRILLFANFISIIILFLVLVQLLSKLHFLLFSSLLQINVYSFGICF